MDVFALGVVLFTMIVGHPPFHEATSDDTLYKCIALKKTDKFWKYHSKQCKQDGKNYKFDDDFKDLII